jgi:hypothetical protein
LSSLASPLAGAFLLIAAPAFASAYGWRRAVPLGAAGAGVAVSVLYGGAGGPFPYLSRVLAWTLIFAVAAVVLTHRLDRPLRILGLTYAPAAVLAFAVPNPIGGNLARLGQLIALPLVWHVLPRLRVGGRKWTIALVFFAALWPVFPSLTSIGKGALDPSQSRPYYTGLLGYLRTQNADSGRLEVVFTREHWESLYVAQNFPLARGWERQTDLGTNHVLYHSLSATAYRRWLDDNAVSLVALPNVPIDFGGVAERSLLQHPPSYLTPVWHDRNWKVWRVQGARGLVSGPATIRDVGAASFVLDFRRPGSATVRIRANEMWSVTRGEGCVSSSPDGWLAVSAEAAGSMTLRARVGVPSLATEKQCS